MSIALNIYTSNNEKIKELMHEALTNKEIMKAVDGVKLGATGRVLIHTIGKEHNPEILTEAVFCGKDGYGQAVLRNHEYHLNKERAVLLKSDIGHKTFAKINILLENNIKLIAVLE
jgi:hypothetical protein